MRATDVKVGVDYVFNRYGRISGRFRARLGDPRGSFTQVTALAEPKGGRVLVKVHDEDRRGEEEVEIRRLIGTWADHTEALAAQNAWRDEETARQAADDARIRELLGPVYGDHDHYYEFRVEADGSYMNRVSSMPRSVFRDLLEAAYANGKAAR